LQIQENISVQLSTTPHGVSRFSQNDKFMTSPLPPAEVMLQSMLDVCVYAAGVHADSLRCALVFDKEQRASFTGVLNWAIKLNAAIESPVTEFTEFSSRKFVTRRASAFAIYRLIVIAK